MLAFLSAPRYAITPSVFAQAGVIFTFFHIYAYLGMFLYGGAITPTTDYGVRPACRVSQTGCLGEGPGHMAENHCVEGARWLLSVVMRWWTCGGGCHGAVTVKVGAPGVGYGDGLEGFQNPIMSRSVVAAGVDSPSWGVIGWKARVSPPSPPPLLPVVASNILDPVG